MSTRRFVGAVIGALLMGAILGGFTTYYLWPQTEVVMAYGQKLEVEISEADNVWARLAMSNTEEPEVEDALTLGNNQTIGQCNLQGRIKISTYFVPQQGLGKPEFTVGIINEGYVGIPGIECVMGDMIWIDQPLGSLLSNHQLKTEN